MITTNQFLIVLFSVVFTVLMIVIWLLVAISQYRSAMKSTDSKDDIWRAIVIGLTSGGIYLAILVDLGVYLWLQTGTLLGVATGSMLLCLMPFVQLITAIGTIVQIRYSRKMSGYVSLLGADYSQKGRSDR